MNEGFDFQMVTENTSSMPEPHLRILEHVSPFWNFIVVFFAIIILVLNKQLFVQRFRMMLSFSYRLSDIEKTTREWNPVMSLNGLSVIAAYVAMLALIVQKTILVFSGNTILYSGFDFYLDICVFIAAFLIVRHLFITLSGWLFGMEAATSHHEVIHVSIITILNIVMIFFGLVVVFYPGKIFLIIILSIILIMTGVRIIKTFFELQILTKMNLFNIFLYLCTLEIIPLSVAATMLYRLIVTGCVL